MPVFKRPAQPANKNIQEFYYLLKNWVLQMKKDLFGKLTAFRSIILFFLVMLTGLVANADGTAGKTKVKPYVFISQTGYGEAGEPATYLNDTKFIEPAVIVQESKDNNVAITNRFYISYYITSGTPDGTKGKTETEKGKTYSVDNATGTRVNTRYGDVETGKSAGIVYVHVVATPSNNYVDQFESAESVYRITLNKVKANAPKRIAPAFVENTQYAENWYAATGSVISLPKFLVEYVTKDNNDKELTLDITKRFDVSAMIENSDLATVVSNYKYNSLESGNAELTTAVIKTGNTAGTVNVKFHFKPKYENAYEDITDFSLPLTIVDEKVTPQLIFPQEEQLVYTGMRSIKAMRPTVYDQYGNDITPSVAYNSGNDKPLWIAWSAAPVAEGKTMHTPLGYCNGTGTLQEWGDQPLTDPNLFRFNNGQGVQMYGPDNIDAGSLVLDKTKARNEFVTPTTDYNALSTCKVVPTSADIFCQVYPRVGDNAANNKYSAVESSYKLLVKPRPMQIHLSPSPKEIELTAGTKIDMYNRFEVTGVHTAEIDDNKFDRKAGETFTLYHNSVNQEFGCQYTFKFKWGDAKIEGYPQVAEQYEPIVVDKNGNKIAKVKDFSDEKAKEYADKGEDVYAVYWSVKGDNRDQNWTLEFLTTKNPKITYTMYPYNIGYYEDGTATTTITEEFNVGDKITPVVKVNPDPMIIYTTDEVFPSQPSVTVTNSLGDDIKEHYDISFLPLPEDLVEAGITIDENGDFVIKDKSKLKQGEYIVNVKVTPKAGETIYNEGQTSFRIIVKNLGDKVRFAWAVVNAKGGASIGSGVNNIPVSDQGDKNHGKLVFTGAGAVSGGYSIDAIPGLAIQLGKAVETGDTKIDTAEDPWIAKESDVDKKVIVYGDPVELDSETGLPVDGTFYVLTPRTNGFVTIDAKFKANNNIVLTDENGKEKQSIKVTDTDAKTQIKFRYPIYAGKTYYLYNDGDDTSNEALRLHGLTFQPAFINQRNDMNPIETATAYANGFSGSLPSLTTGKVEDENVRFAIDGKIKTGAETVNDKCDEISEYAEISKTGVVKTMNQGTHGRLDNGEKKIDNYGSLSFKEHYLKVYAEVKSAYKGGETLKKVPAYDLYIGDIPTYVMDDGYTPDVLENISTTNYPTKIRAFFGGWENGENRPYIKNNKINETDPDKIVMLVDSWKTSKMDSVGSNNRVVDNFAYASFGTQNASSETVNGTFKYDKTNEDQTYNVPCRGTYLQFEPNESGTIAVYIIQNGMVAYDGDPENAKKSGMNKIKLNPVFITDETGTPVKLAAWNHTQEGQGDKTYTEAAVRCNYADIIKDCGSIDAASDKTAISLLEKIGYIPAEGATASISRGDGQNVIDIAKTLYPDDQNVVAGSLGYSVITKAYTRYSFDVKAGKTYFVFMNGSKLGNNGFAFMPLSWSADRTVEDNKPNMNLPLVVLDEKGTAEGSKDQFLSKIQSKEDFDIYDMPVNVELYHSFQPGQWTALSLPFSINDTQFRRIFGDDAWAISLDEIAQNTEVNGETYDNVALFTQHNYHWIVAGRPYFVKPGKDFKYTNEDETNERKYILISDVTFEHSTYEESKARSINNNEYIGSGYIEPKTLKANKNGFNFKASYMPCDIQAGDYFVGTKDGEAKLYRATGKVSLLGYRAYIDNQGKANDARIGAFSYGDITEDGNRGTTGIDAIFDSYDNGMNGKLSSKKGVFSVDGVKVAEKASDIDRLPAGVYIINGQTFVK